MAKYICTQKITFYLGDFEEKYFEFQEGNEYDFIEMSDLFALKKNKEVGIGKQIFFKHFVLASDLENKGETEDSRNIIKDAINLGTEASNNIFDAFKEAQEIKDEYQNTSRKISDLPKEIVETDSSDFDFHSQQRNSKFFKKVMDSLSDKEKLNFQSDLEIKTPKHYDNSKGTLYKVAQERNWSPYLFDIVKRLERADKKGEFETDLEKSIAVIQLWLKESKS